MNIADAARAPGLSAKGDPPLRGDRPCRIAAGAERLAPIQPGQVQRLKFLGQARQFGFSLQDCRDPAHAEGRAAPRCAGSPRVLWRGWTDGWPACRSCGPWSRGLPGPEPGPQPPLRPAWTARRRAGQFDLMNARMAAISPSVRISPKAGIPEVMGTPMSSRTACPPRRT